MGKNSCGKHHVAHTFTNLLAHVIFSTKNRAPLIDAELKPRLLPYLGGIAKELNVRPICLNGVADHVHGLFVLPANVCVADFLRVLKTNASRRVHETWKERTAFAWQTGYGAFSVSESNAADVVQYIEKQAEHHR